MSTATCFKNKITELNKQIEASKLSGFKCDNLDISFNLLKEENLKLKEVINENNKNDPLLDNDGSAAAASNVSVFNICLIYVILITICGLFYNNLLSTSIIQILNENKKLSDFVVSNKSDYDILWNKISSSLNSYRFFLFLNIFVFTLIINVGIIYITILKGTNFSNALKIVSISSMSIIGLTFLLTSIVSFTKIFENTIGYTVAKMFSPKKDYNFTQFINSLFIHKTFEKGGVDFSFLFAAFRLDNLGHILSDIGSSSSDPKYDFYIKSSAELNDDLNILAERVVMKNTVGQLCWILFASIASTIVSIKYLAKDS